MTTGSPRCPTLRWWGCCCAHLHHVVGGWAPARAVVAETEVAHNIIAVIGAPVLGHDAGHAYANYRRGRAHGKRGVNLF